MPLRRATQPGGAVVLEGPAGSGKTTLLRREFPDRVYITLRDPAARQYARTGPAAFLARLRMAAIVDDIHRAPELVQHLARTSENKPILFASSRKLCLPFTTLRLYHPTRAELEGRPPLPLDVLGRFVPAAAAVPRAVHRWPQPRDLNASDVGGLVQVRDFDRFENFLLLARERSGQVLDQQKLARPAGTSRTTVTRWLAVLDACLLTTRLEPSDQDFGRRLVRGPKLHFLDSSTFESAVVSEIYRNAVHTGDPPDFRYWRDSNGSEIALVIQSPNGPVPVSIVENPTPVDEARLLRWLDLAGARRGAMVTRRPSGPHGGRILRYTPDLL